MKLSLISNLASIVLFLIQAIQSILERSKKQQVLDQKQASLNDLSTTPQEAFIEKFTASPPSRPPSRVSDTTPSEQQSTLP